MSRSRKHQQQWKRKERKRMGSKDPAKIKLHRERFLQRIKERSLREMGYGAMVFRSTVAFDTKSYETTVCVEGEIIGKLPYLAEDVAECHFLIAQREPKFDPVQEKRYLTRHVTRVKRQGITCHLEVLSENVRQCASVIDCPYRKWRSEQVVAECTR